jgi:hypothetical protein
MDKDRTAICNIIGEMLDNPDGSGIYPTSRAFDKLEVKRILQPNDYPTLDLGGGMKDTHKMAWTEANGEPMRNPHGRSETGSRSGPREQSL